MIDQQNELAPALRGQLESRGNLLCTQGAGFGVMPGTGRLTRVMKQERKIEYIGIFHMAKEGLVLRQLWILCVDQQIELLDTNKRVFIGRVPVKKLMLHQASQIAKLGKV